MINYGGQERLGNGIKSMVGILYIMILERLLSVSARYRYKCGLGMYILSPVNVSLG